MYAYPSPLRDEYGVLGGDEERGGDDERASALLWRLDHELSGGSVLSATMVRSCGRIMEESGGRLEDMAEGDKEDPSRVTSQQSTRFQTEIQTRPSSAGHRTGATRRVQFFHLNHHLLTSFIICNKLTTPQCLLTRKRPCEQAHKGV